MNSRVLHPAFLQQARERFHSGTLAPTSVRPTVLDSWQRSRSRQVDPDRVHLSFVRQPDTKSPLAIAAVPVVRRLSEDLTAQQVSVVLCSADGLVIDRRAPESPITRLLDDVFLSPGYSYAESITGTNGIGTTIATGRPTMIFGSEHYVDQLSAFACAAAPIRHPMSREIIGVIDLTCHTQRADPMMLTLAKTAARQIEERLTTLASRSEAALMQAYQSQCRRTPYGVLAVGGDLILMNQYLRARVALTDQLSLFAHANDLTKLGSPASMVATLPSGITVKIVAAVRALTAAVVASIEILDAPKTVDTTSVVRDRVLRFLDRNLADATIDAAKVAEGCGMSRRTLYRVLGDEGVASQLRGMRIERAKQLLNDRPEWAISRVGTACGFDTESGFHRAFRTATGQTPGQYRTAARLALAR